jgi:hypothetical protein
MTSTKLTACRGSSTSPTATTTPRDHSLRVAARKTTQDGLSTIPARIVEESTLAAGEEVRRKTISKLNQYQRVVFEILESKGPLIQKELYERYSEAHEHPVTLRYLREKYLPKLDTTGLLRLSGTGRGGSTLSPKLGAVFEIPSQYSLEIRPFDKTIEYDRGLSRVRYQSNKSA